MKQKINNNKSGISNNNNNNNNRYNKVWFYQNLK